MRKLWQSEKKSFIFTLLTIFLSGLVFGHWAIVIAVVLSVYLGWIYFRLFQLEQWLSGGTKLNSAIHDNGYIGVIDRHIYALKKQHNKRKKKAKEILRRLKTNISALPDATVLLNQKLEIEWVNNPAKLLLGITQVDIGQRIQNLLRHPKLQSYLMQPDQSASLEIKSPLDSETDLSIKIVRFGKNQRLLIIRNISDQTQHAEALKHFVANASHELQTPLTAIIGHLELLDMDQEGLSESAKNSLTILQQQSERMKLLIQDLLMLSRIESYQLRVDEGEKIVIPEVMTDVMSVLGKSCDNKLFKCHFPEQPCLLGIKSEIEGICINLIENAIKHNPENTQVDIRWEVSEEGEYVFTVSDKGQGIGELDLPYITNRYYRGSYSTARQISGSGLGLAIVQQVVQKHGAKLEIDSEVNQGSSFRVIFPNYRVLDKCPDLQAAGR